MATYCQPSRRRSTKNGVSSETFPDQMIRNCERFT